MSGRVLRLIAVAIALAAALDPAITSDRRTRPAPDVCVFPHPHTRPRACQRDPASTPTRPLAPNLSNTGVLP